jgi:putative hydrolase of the HAD superfamily
LKRSKRYFKCTLGDENSSLWIRGLYPEIEIVGQKSSENYARILEKFRVAPELFLMVGNSLRSDILPVLELGGHAVYIPSDITWIHEEAEAPQIEQTRFYQLEHIGELPALLVSIEAV